MLYHLYETQRIALLPARLAAEYAQHLLRNPFNPGSDTYLARVMAAACEVFEHVTREYDKPAFGFDHTVVEGAVVPVREEIVARRSFADLRHFRRELNRRDPKVLVVAPMSGHFAALLRDTVAPLLPGHDVYITDWRDARDVPISEGAFDLDDYIDYLTGFLRELGPDTHVIAICQPAVPALAATALMAAQDDSCAPASMVLIGGPIDTRMNPTQINQFGKSHPLSWFEQNMISTVPAAYPGAGRRVVPGFIQLAGFMGRNIGQHFDVHRRFFYHLIKGDERSAAATWSFYEDYRAVMDLAAEFYLQTVHTVFHEHLLPRGLMVSRGRPIDPRAVTRTALMTIEGERDTISGNGQTRAAHTLLCNVPEPMHEHYEQSEADHYGIFNGTTWREQIAPRVRRFIRAHDRAAGAAQG